MVQYNVNSPEEYMASLDEDWRKDRVAAIRVAIQEKFPDLVEGVEYRMLSYSDERGSVFHLNAQKNYVSLYVGDIDRVDPDGSILPGIDRGKGCVRLKKTSAISEQQVVRFLERVVELRASGVDIGC